MAIPPDPGTAALDAAESAQRAGTLNSDHMAALVAEQNASNARADAMIAESQAKLAAQQRAQASGAAGGREMADAPALPPSSTPGASTAAATSPTGPAASPAPELKDKRIRIKCKPGKEDSVYGSADPANPMSILRETGGLIFPYTPTIQYQQNPLWQSQELTHFIQQYYYFTATESAQITITGRFTIQNAYEGRYLLAVFHFLRSYSKMHFGLQEPEATRGLPPPVLLLDGYGPLMFNNLPIIIRTWNIDFPDNVDYIKVSTGRSDNSAISASTSQQGGLGDAYLPSMTNVNIVAMVQRPPNTLKNEFNLAEFKNGNLLRRGGFT